MPLDLIHGPPNSGRAGLVRRHFNEALGKDPVLVVPTLDDVFGFEREIAAKAGAALGGSVLTFRGLFGEVARAAGRPLPPAISQVQRLRLLRAATDGIRLGPLGRSALRPGFAAALNELIEELQASGLDPGSVAAGASSLEGSAYLSDLGALYAAYVELRDSLGLVDSHGIASEAIQALRRSPDSWRGRPVMLYGFDDLTGEQLDLVNALAQATEITLALTFEDRDALSARAGLLGDLRELGPREETRTEPDPGNTESGLLFQLERSFLVEGAQRTAPDGSLRLLRSAGDRGEAELIGAEIAELLRSGAEPGGIAVALRDPAARGPLYARVLRSYGIPVALEADVRVAATATGGCLLALLRAVFTTRTASDLLAFLRGPRRAAPGSVDWLERSIRRGRLQSAEQAEAAWEQSHDKALADPARLRDAATSPARLLATLAAVSRDIAQWPLSTEGSRGEVPERGPALELRAGEALATALEELAALPGVEPTPEELVATVESLTMPLWTGPAEGRVRLASPYRLRASRFRHLFVASLQDGEFPRHGGDGPFLSDEQRAAVGLPKRRLTEQEERYLFYVCLSLPRERLYLSYRSSDAAGGAEAPSPFLAEVRDLLEPAPPQPGETDPLEEGMTRSRGLGDVLFEPADAPSEAELARAVAALGDVSEAGRALERAGVAGERAERISARVEAAATTEQATDAPGPLRVDAVKGALGEIEVYGGTTLENFDVCSYRWFVDHELDPESLDPTPEPLAQGDLMHRALERLYRERPGGDAMPRPASLAAWVAGAQLVVAELSESLSDHPADRAIRRRVDRLLVAFLVREAAREAPRLEPSLLEANFGRGENADRPPLQIDDWALHGFIDRIDEGAGVGLVQDYKLSSKVTPVAKFVENGALQLPLYILAVRKLWDKDVVGGLYQPLRSPSPRPRGLVRDDGDGELLADLGLVGKDVLAPEDFEAAITDARDRATGAVARMRAGDIRRDPGPPEGVRGHDQCPTWCGFAPVCRRERAPLLEPPDEEEDA